MSKNKTPTITVKKALDDMKQGKFMLSPMRKSPGGYPSIPIVYRREDGSLGDVYIQIGTMDDPIWNQSGLQVYQNNKYESVRNGMQFPSGKMQSNLILHNFTEQGRQGNYVYEFVNAIIDLAVKQLANGVPGSNGEREQIVSIPGAPTDPTEFEKFIRFMMTTPIRDADGPYAPTLRTKVRVNNNNGFITIVPKITDSETRQQVPAQQHLNVFKERTHGVYIIKFNEIGFKKAPVSLHLTVEVMKVMIKKSKSQYDDVDFADVDAAMDDAEFQ